MTSYNHTGHLYILVVDDHPIVMKGIHALLSAAFAYAHIICVESKREAEDILGRRSVDIMITDLELRNESGLALIKNTRNISPETQVVIYTMHEEPWTVCEIAEADTEAVVMKSDNANELIMAVRSLSEGKGYYSPTFYRLLCSQKENPNRLSKRELQVIELTAKGMSAASISAQLDISVNTVEFHRRRIMQKLNVATSSEMIKRATELGWDVNI